MRFTVEVVVVLKPVVNDPQGLVVRQGLHQLGFASVSDVRVGKHIEIELEAGTEAEAATMADQMCERLLRNPVIEQHRVAAVRSGDPTPA